MSNIEIWLVIACLALATVIDRSAFWLVGHHVNLPKRVLEALRYAPSCALAAIIVPDILLNENQMVDVLANPKLIAAVLSTGFFLWKRDMVLTIIFGMAVFTVIRLFL
jgi:branched-subunit amino acid transport protein